jgi:serine/threonine protein kinase
VPILKYWLVPNFLIFAETEVPELVSNLKTFCKLNMSQAEIL